MAPFAQLAGLAALAALAAAESAAGQCAQGACEADETGLLQQGARLPARRTPAQSLADAGEELEAEPARSDKRWWWDEDDTVLSFKPCDIDKALEMGTAANIGPNFDTSVLDLTGIWYIKWDPNANLAIKLYMKQRMEIAVTFAGSTISNYSDPNSSFKLRMPGQLPRHWAYSDSFQSTLQMFAHSTRWPYCQDLTYEFENSRRADILGIGPFIYLNEDQWQRPTETQAGNFTYNLSRIVYANGTKTKHYSDYMNLMKGYNIEVWNSTDQKARCESTAPVSSLCYLLVDKSSCQS